MKVLKPLVLLVALLATFLLTGWHKAEKESNAALKQHVIVMLKFKAQPDKGTVAISALKALLNEVKEEPHFISIKLHVDPNDPTNILLYEEWEDASYYNGAHMNTRHLLGFMNDSRNFLTGPPEISFWEVKHMVE